MKQLTITTTGQNQVIDITDKINVLLPETFSGLATITVMHTTCALTTADLDPGTDQDLIDALKHLVPKIHYRHPHNPEPEHVGDHIMTSLIGTSISFPVLNGSLHMGTWQKLILIEMNGPRQRNITLTITQESSWD